jgi:adenosylmethionine-8-amino-7-oxononanoate aminotransferase
MHAFTYSAHPTCCAVALANIGIIQQEQLINRVADAGERLWAGLQSLESIEHVGHVRSLGLIGGVEVVADRTTKALFPPAAGVSQRLADALLDRGVYTRVAMDGICIAPPLVVTDEQIDRIVEAIADAVPAVVNDVREAVSP